MFDGVFRPSVGRYVPGGVEIVSVGLDHLVMAAVIAPDGSARYFRDGVQIPHVDRVPASTMTRMSARFAQFMPEEDFELFAELYDLSPQRAAEALLVHAPGMPMCRETWLYAARIHDRLNEALKGAEYIVRLPLSFA
ncbi:hypothetical protein [Nocardia sp. NPDC127526]|uniref:hypothetical protein n=1 Tax=Nocardia sp. NPDC127526 TaxID=3345393 RepID=UPI0036394FE6